MSNRFSNVNSVRSGINTKRPSHVLFFLLLLLYRVQNIFFYAVLYLKCSATTDFWAAPDQIFSVTHSCRCFHTSWASNTRFNFQESIAHLSRVSHWICRCSASLIWKLCTQPGIGWKPSQDARFLLDALTQEGSYRTVKAAWQKQNKKLICQLKALPLSRPRPCSTSLEISTE